MTQDKETNTQTHSTSAPEVREVKKRPRKKKEPLFDEETEQYLRQIAKQMAGKPLEEAFKKGSALKNLIAKVVEVALEEELTEHLGYEPHVREKDPQQPKRRSNTRNGRLKKAMQTTHGEVELAVPRDRQSSFEPQLVKKSNSITQEVEERILSMYAGGMSTRDIQAHVEELYGYAASEMFVSRVVEKLDPALKEWRNRPLEPVYAVVFVDAFFVKLRHAHGVEPTAMYHVCGYGEKGVLETLGIYMAPEGHSTKESASFWHHVMVELQQRGLKAALIVCADGLSGLPEAVKLVYPQARFQPCVVHLLRNSWRMVKDKDRVAVAKALKKIYDAVSYEAAELGLQELEDQWKKSYPSLVKQWKGNLEALGFLFQYGAALRKLVYTTNPIENVHRQVRKVIKTRGAFPNAESALRLVSVVLRKHNDKIAKQRGTRADWNNIVAELHLHFEEFLPKNWGFR